MKQIAKKIYKKIFPTIYVKHCSQTTYQALLAAIHMYQATQDQFWLSEAKKIKNILLDIQQEDGGWDIGYFFNFGYYHKKGESTSPELLSLVALIKYWEIDNDDKVENSIQRGIDWIIRHSYKFEGDWVIPYGPYSTRDVVVYNGISFAQAPLAMWSRYETSKVRKNKIVDIYRGMNSYLARQLVSAKHGSYMLYSLPRENMGDKARGKVDYYHMAQQLEMHNYANEYCPDDNALKIVTEFGEHILHMQDANGAVPYYNNMPEVGIHVWGFCSVINAFVDMHLITGNSKYLYAGTKVKDWIIKNALNNKYFCAVLSREGRKLNNGYYPRSDAWVINALSKIYGFSDNRDELLKIIEGAYSTLSDSNYSGLEYHAGTRVRLIIRKFLMKMLSG